MRTGTSVHCQSWHVAPRPNSLSPAMRHPPQSRPLSVQATRPGGSPPGRAGPERAVWRTIAEGMGTGVYWGKRRDYVIFSRNLSLSYAFIPNTNAFPCTRPHLLDHHRCACRIVTCERRPCPILGQFMKMMVMADVLHIRDHELLDRASLLAAKDGRRQSAMPLRRHLTCPADNRLQPWLYAAVPPSSSPTRLPAVFVAVVSLPSNRHAHRSVEGGCLPGCRVVVFSGQHFDGMTGDCLCPAFSAGHPARVFARLDASMLSAWLLPPVFRGLRSIGSSSGR